MDNKLKMKELEARVAELKNLLRNWIKTWNDNFDPEGDLLDDTNAALETDSE